MGKGKGRPGKPRGATYADMLAQKRFQQAVCEKAVNDAAVQVQSEIRTQRELWMCCIAMNRAFDIGPKRFRDFARELQGVVDWYQEMLCNVDEVYAQEKLRRLAARCSGTEIAPLYDKEMEEAIRKEEAHERGDHEHDRGTAAGPDADRAGTAE